MGRSWIRGLQRRGLSWHRIAQNYEPGACLGQPLVVGHEHRVHFFLQNSELWLLVAVAHQNRATQWRRAHIKDSQLCGDAGLVGEAAVLAGLRAGWSPVP